METDLLYKYISGDATDSERIQVVTWIDADKAHMEEYIKLRKTYDALAWVDENKTQEHRANKIKLNRTLTWLGRIASILVIALLSSYFFNKYNGDEQSTSGQMISMIIPAGQYGEIILADGSHIWLNAQSRLDLPSEFGSGSRELYLHGEAFFDVASDEKSPFIVHTKEYSVKALGTEFNICSFDKDEDSKTSLLSGKVNITLKESGESYDLMPNQEFKYSNNQVSLRAISNFSHFEWKNGFISFENETLKTLFETLSKCYDVKIDVKNKKILRDKYTGKFKIKDGPEQALKVLQLRSAFKYKKQGDDIVIENK